MASLTMTQAVASPLAVLAAVARPVLQRKCACGQHSATGECEECKKNKSEEKTSRDPLLQRSAVNCNPLNQIPTIVHEVLRSPGQPLDAPSRAFFERRFGQDFSQVRVHDGRRAAESAAAVGALAYTVGSSIVFGSGQFQPESAASQKLFAHELAHTLQQREMPARGDLRIGPAGDVFEREAEAMARSAMEGEVPGHPFSHSQLGFLRRKTNPLQPNPPPPRGTNPSACMAPICTQVAKSAAPSSNAKASGLADEWVTNAKSCVTSGAASSNASHQAEIAMHEQAEMDAEAAELKKNWAQRPKGAFSNSEFIKWLGDTCKRRQRQVEIEFRYNVLFENPPAGLRWDQSASDWDPIESALEALPDQATWTNARLLQFHREACHPDDVDPATGTCAGKTVGPLTKSFTGGQTDLPTGKITVYNEGLGSQPYLRSRNLKLSATAQTIRHEVGHVMADEIPQDKRMEFFEKIVRWIDYPWAWITPRNPPYPTWKVQRDKVKAELGFDDARLDAWLPTLQQNVPVSVGARTYVQTGPGGAYLTSFPTANLPTGAEFEYARTNQGEYLAELYALAVSNPEFLHRALPRPQILWLKTEVFDTARAIEEVSRGAAVGEPQLSEFLDQTRMVFTIQQAKAALNEVLAKPRARTGTVA